MEVQDKIILEKKKRLYDFDYNVFCLFKKKIFKKKKKIYIKKYVKLLNFLKIYFFSNLYELNNYIDIDMYKYNVLKNFWLLFLFFYKCSYEIKVKLFIMLFFQNFIKKNLIKNIFFNFKKKRLHFFFKELKLKNILQKKNIKIKINVIKIFKSNINSKLKINFCFSFFNYYKKNLLIKVIKYFSYFYNIKIKKEFIFFWIRYYKYSLKLIYKAADYIFRFYMKYFYLQYKLFASLVSFKEKKIKKNIFFFIFFFKKNKNWYLNNFIINKLYGCIFKLNNFEFFKKTNFNFFFFNLSKNKLVRSTIKKKKYLLNIFMKMSVFLKLNNFFFLFILKCLIIWLNFFLVVKKNNIIDKLFFSFYLINNKFRFSKLFLFIGNRSKIKSLFKMDFFFYNNMIKSVV